LANDGEWRYLRNVKVNPKSDSTAYTEWFLPRIIFRWATWSQLESFPIPENMDTPEGTVSLEGNMDQKFVRVMAMATLSNFMYHPLNVYIWLGSR